MILRNPTDKEITIQFEGTLYSVDAESTVEVSDKVGEHWLGIHEFLVVESEEPKEEKKTTKKVEKKEEDKE